MKADEMTFGIEIETTLPADLPIEIGRYHHGIQVPWLPQGWKAESDTSIRYQPGVTKGCEFVGPVLRGIEGLLEVVAVVRKLTEMGAKVNDSCGLHIHVGFDRSNTVALNRLLSLVANFEKAIYATTGTDKRERGIHSRGLQRHGSLQSAMNSALWDRYHLLNLASSKPTVEFRAFAGTLNIVKIVGHVLMALGLVERASGISRLPKFVAKEPVATSPIHRSGRGQTEVTRLYYQLGWTKGRTSYTYGDLSGEGLPTIAEIKKELMRLAKKYDRSQA